MNTTSAKHLKTAREGSSENLQHEVIYMSAEELTLNIHGSAMNDRISQKKIYTSFYNYAKTIADRYATRHDDSIEIVNDTFLKIFLDIHRYKPAYSDVVSSFKGWLRRILIHTAIDHYRKNNKHDKMNDLPDNIIQLSSNYESAFDKISYQEIIAAIQDLSPGYRTIFNLYVIEGHTHIEISKMVGITVGASKSNLSKAKKQLQKILFERNQFQISTV